MCVYTGNELDARDSLSQHLPGRGKVWQELCGKCSWGSQGPGLQLPTSRASGQGTSARKAICSGNLASTSHSPEKGHLKCLKQNFFSNAKILDFCLQGTVKV